MRAAVGTVRRCESCGQPIVAPDGLFFDEETAIAGRTGNPHLVRLSPSRIRILTALYNARGRPVAKEVLYDALYGALPDCDQPKCPTVLPVQIHSIRKAIKPLGLIIETAHRFGWQLRDVSDKTPPQTHG